MVEAVAKVSDLSIYIVVVVAISLVAPIILDVFFAYRQRTSHNNGKGPTGMQGLYRTLMAVGILLIILVLSIQMLVIFDTNMSQITTLLETTNPQNFASNKVITGIVDEKTIQLMPSQPHIQSITTNNPSSPQTTDNSTSPQTTDNPLPITDTLSFWNAVNSVLELNTLFAGMIKDVVVILTGALSSIIGFYFGSRGAISAAKAATESADKDGNGGTESKDEGKGTGGVKDTYDATKQEPKKTEEPPPPSERTPSTK